MGELIRKTLTMLGLLASVAIFGANAACSDAWWCLGIDLLEVAVYDPADPYYYNDGCYYQWSADHDGEEEKAREAGTRLFVTGSPGSNDELTLEYGPYDFQAERDAETGLYRFEPDPDGEISGNPIACSANIGEEEIEGDCERGGSFCSFTYEREKEGEEGELRGYDLVTTTCEEREGVGPFYLSD